MTAAADVKLLTELAELKALLAGGVAQIVERVSNLERAVVEHSTESRRFQEAASQTIDRLGERVLGIDARLTLAEQILARQEGLGVSGR